MSRLGIRLAVSTVATGLLLLGLLPGGAFSKGDELERRGSRYVQTIDRSFDVDPGGLLSVDVTGGPIEVDTWEKNSVRVLIEKKVKSRSEEDAREILEDHATTVEQDGNDINITTRGGSHWWGGDRIEASYRISVPRRFNLELETAGGSIEVDDLDGDVFAKTAGGSIEAGRITGEVKLHTAGGSIELAGGGGNTEAKTSGGSIAVGDCGGDVVVETSGGSISVNGAAGKIAAETSGGSIRLGPANGDVKASTGGGSIRIASSGGEVRASTAGGSISVDGSAGPVNVSTSGGSISIRDARAGVTAKTNGGSITAELNAERGVEAASDLETSGGDITVYLPEDASVTIKARIDRTRDEHTIHSDFPMELDASGDRARATVKIGGGKAKIRLRTREGDIFIKNL
jgi:DUF4097 and DUF4098 domain-containing protein YvlB